MKDFSKHKNVQMLQVSKFSVHYEKKEIFVLLDKKMTSLDICWMDIYK